MANGFLRVILVFVYYGVVAPIGLVVRLFRDPLDRVLPDARGSFWTKKEPVSFDPKQYEKQR